MLFFWVGFFLVCLLDLGEKGAGGGLFNGWFGFFFNCFGFVWVFNLGRFFSGGIFLVFWWIVEIFGETVP